MTARCHVSNYAMSWKPKGSLHTTESLTCPLDCSHESSVAPGDPHSTQPPGEFRRAKQVGTQESSF